MLKKYSRMPFVTAALVTINVIVFLISMFTGQILYYLGGVDRMSITVYHEFGRLIWALFLHDDTAHLFNNMVILLFLGAMIEKEIGHISFFIIYFLSGIGGNLASLCHKIAVQSDSLSIGASGAIFGLDGLLLALALFSSGFRETVSPSRAAVVIALSLYNGFLSDNIDNAAHVGGLVIGFLAGMVYAFVYNINNKHGREVQI